MTLKNKIQLLMSYNSWSHIQNYKIITPSSTKKKKKNEFPPNSYRSCAIWQY